MDTGGFLRLILACLIPLLILALAFYVWRGSRSGRLRLSRPWILVSVLTGLGVLGFLIIPPLPGAAERQSLRARIRSPGP